MQWQMGHEQNEQILNSRKWFPTNCGSHILLKNRKDFALPLTGPTKC